MKHAHHPSARPLITALVLALILWHGITWAGFAEHYTLRDIGPDYMRGGFVEVTDLEKDQEIVIGIFDDSGYPHAIEIFPTPHYIGPIFSRAISIDGSRIVGYITQVEGGRFLYTFHATV